MAKFCLKKQSKRQPARLRYKIEKKVRDHNRKLRKEAKKNPKKGTKLTRVPNICPFKEDILKEVEALKLKKDEEKLRAREAAKEERKTKREQMQAQDLGTLVSNAEMRDKVFEIVTPETGDKASNKVEKSLKAYYKEFRKVIEAADIILEVVDARDPLGTSCLEVEKAVYESAGSKRLVIVMTKADLVPYAVVDQWIKYLRRKAPVVPFKSSTQNQSKNLGRRKIVASKGDQSLQGSSSVGAELLMSLLGNYCRNKGVKTSILVGVVGLPNVGKSSLINSLKRSKACNVGSTPGVTKSMQEVQLDSKIKLLDSPGVVFSSGTDAGNCLRNVVSVSKLSDPLVPATAVLQRIAKEQIRELYDIADFKDFQEFFTLRAGRMGRFKKGGIPDIQSAARSLIDDWNKGKIKYYTVPPEENENDIHISASIVSEVAKEFDLENFESMQIDVLNELNKHNAQDGFLVNSLGVANEMLKMEEDDEQELISNKVKVEVKKNKQRKRKADNQKKIDPEMQLEGNRQLNQVRKLEFKKKLKNEKRRQKSLLQLQTAAVSKTDAAGDSYDFQSDFEMK